MKTKTSGFRYLVSVALLALFAFSAYADVPVQEVQGPLMQYMQEIKQLSQENLQINQERLELLEDWHNKLMEISETAKQMSELSAQDQLIEDLSSGDNSIMDLENKGDYEKDSKSGLPLDVARHIRLESEYAILQGKVIVPALVTDPPYWMAVEEEGAESSFSLRTKNLLLKVSAQVKKSLSQQEHAYSLNNMVRSIADEYLPSQLFSRLNSSVVTRRLIQKEGVISLGEGIISRPTTYQDRVCAKFANLDSTEEDKLLFWSDPVVLNGYHPVLGASLNHTMLKGYKMFDLDNILSRGHSKLIDQQNMLKPVERRVQNPFRGYASRVMPGLLAMARRGQLNGVDQPTDDQLANAIRLSKTIKTLPSQRMNLQKTTYRLIQPPRVIRVDSSGEGGTSVIPLPKLEKRSFIRDMILCKKRLHEIAKLKREIRMGREYADKIIRTYLEFDGQAAGVAHGMSDDGSIPQITQLRKDITFSIEYYRGILSTLQHRYDDLLHREWIILQHILDTRYRAIAFLMDDAAIRYRIALLAKSEGGSGE